ncbi:PLB1-like protein [Mya arenaria]|uniref:PLB1-like protein n=1 Tax=Mya arenaria TaxID=6604 RepID=A0ABY7FCS6_MYAAR|nr:PLB1-like protein [Mya arenaria]
MDTMMKYLVFVVCLQLSACDYADYAKFVRSQEKNETFVRLFEQHLKLFKDDGKPQLKSGEEFHCKPYPAPAAKTTSVHSLRPMDIKVVGALGDSITAGTGITASTVIGLLREDRGLSWSVGGEKSVNEEETIPNILKVYNKELKGFSTGWGPVWTESSHLNVANPGDTSEDMPGQAELIVKRMKEDKTIDYDNDWKLITLFSKYSAENYVGHIQQALDYLHANVPRAFVNVVQILDVAIIKRLNANIVCDALHLFLCKCAAFPANSEAEADLVAETQRYRDQTAALVQSGRYDTRDDFTAVVQPFFTETRPPMKEGSEEPDLSYFAPDCFHLSLKGHRAAADALWNNMIEPMAQKRKYWSPGEKIECPSAEHPYFYTYKNSQPGIDAQPGLLGSRSQSYSSSQSDTNTGSQSMSITSVVIAAVAMGAVVLVVVGVVAWRRRSSVRRQSYTSI